MALRFVCRIVGLWKGERLIGFTGWLPILGYAALG